MTDLDLAAIEADALADEGMPPEVTLALVAALREARAEAERWRGFRLCADHYAGPDGRTYNRDTCVVCLVHGRDDWRRRYEALTDDRAALIDQRNAALNRYEALRDGVTALHIERTGMVGCRECGYDIPCDTLRVVARVEES